MKVITIGSGHDNDIRITDACVSRVHLQLVKNDKGVCSAIDLSSTNGTYINGKRIEGEVYLHANDVVRIGNTIIPWEKYLNTKTVSKSGIVLWAGIITGIALLLAVSGVLTYSHFKGKSNNPATENKNVDPVDKTERLEKEADDLFRHELIIQNKEYKEEAQKAIGKANEATRRAKTAEQAQQDAEEARLNAENARKDAEKAQQEAEEARQNAEDARKKAEKDQNDAVNNAIKAQNDAEIAREGARLAEQFYSEFSEMNEDEAKAACINLKIDINNNNNYKAALKARFTTAGNVEKKTIVEAIKTLREKAQVPKKKDKDTEKQKTAEDTGTEEKAQNDE